MTTMHQAILAIFVVLTIFSKQTLSFKKGKEYLDSAYDTIEFTSRQTSRRQSPKHLHLRFDSFIIDNKNNANYQWIIVGTNIDINQWKLGKSVNPTASDFEKLVDGEARAGRKTKVTINREFYKSLLTKYSHFILLKKRKFTWRIRKAGQYLNNNGWRCVGTISIKPDLNIQEDAVLTETWQQHTKLLQVNKEEDHSEGKNPLSFMRAEQIGQHPELTHETLCVQIDTDSMEATLKNLYQFDGGREVISPLWFIQAEKLITVNGEVVPAYTIRNYISRNYYLGYEEIPFGKLVTHAQKNQETVEEFTKKYYNIYRTHFYWIRNRHTQGYDITYYYEPVSVTFL